jgi:hypothetical protein
MDLKTTMLVETSVPDQISAAFDCCEAALKKARVEEGVAVAHKTSRFFTDN